VVASWVQKSLPLDVRSCAPLSAAQIAIAHDRGYVDDVLSLSIANGFETYEQSVADALPYTNASFLAAAREALRNGLVACSPTSGFHHAGWNFGGGFCTFNGLMVAARTLLRENAVQRLGILDCDAHQGNGTDDILRRVPKEEAARVEHYTRHRPHYGPRGTTTPAEFLAHLPVLLEGWRDRGVELVLYQAGADPHIDDPFGAGLLTGAELRARDAVVFETCRRLGMPVVWNLAGGYQEDETFPEGSAERVRKVLDIHDATMEECVRVHLGADRSVAT
jgi:acetoin utilization deacetylase AcuC-like enzyme